MLADRDKVKELLQQLLPNFKRKVDKDLEDKNRILVENPNLLQLYKDLVITKVLTSDEFWATHAKDHALKKMAKSQEIGKYIYYICLYTYINMPLLVHRSLGRFLGRH